MTKLKIYRFSLLTSLFLLVFGTLFFLVLTAMNFADYAEVMDGVMYIIAFVVLLAFVGLEIGNTIVSFKKGSNFVKALAYDSDKEINKRGLFIFALLLVVSLGASIYMLFVILGYNIFFSALSKPVQYIAFMFFLTAFVDMTFILLYPPLVGTQEL